MRLSSSLVDPCQQETGPLEVFVDMLVVETETLLPERGDYRRMVGPGPFVADTQ